MDARPSWELQETETLRAFAAFELYRNMLPAERTLNKTRIALGRRAGYQRVLEQWSSTHHWVRRAADFDAYIDSARVAKHKKAVEDMADRHVRQGMILQDAGFRVFLDADGNLKPLIGDSLPPSVAIRAIEVGAKMERLGLGEATMRISVKLATCHAVVPSDGPLEEQSLAYSLLLLVPYAIYSTSACFRR
jgi:hypothetical protein